MDQQVQVLEKEEAKKRMKEKARQKLIQKEKERIVA
jgi:hypothetical protein